jgi:repressor LexA
MTPAGTTKRQADALTFITGFIASHGYSPSYTEIGDALGIKGRGRIHELVAALEERGLVRKLPHRARSIAIVGRRAA